MKKFVISIALFAVVVLGVGAPLALAQKPLKGNWIFMVSVPGLGTFPVPITYAKKGKGTVALPPTPLALAYREGGANFSSSTETPASSSPTGAGFTIVLRGTKTSDNSVMGKAVIITDTTDSSATGFMQIPGTFSGQRQ